MISEEQQKKYEELQSSVDHGHQPGLLDPEEVATDFLATDLNIKDLYKVYDKSEKSVAGDHTTVTLLKEGKPVWKIELYQPVKKGTGGIWVVTNWTDCKTNTKHAVA